MNSLMSFTPLKNEVAAESHHSSTLGTGALTLSLPLSASGILMQALAQNIRYTLDGTTPAAASGFQLKAGDPPIYIQFTKGMVLTFFRETSGAILEYEYSA